MKIIIALCLIFASMQTFANPRTFENSERILELSDGRAGSYYDWGRAKNGWGYCYMWSSNGYVLNEGRPVSNYNCERYRPSYYDWGKGVNGYTYCYQWTSYRVAMNEGKPVDNYYCH